MKFIDFTNIKVHTPMLDFQLEGENIDLHNDFDCKSIQYDSLSKNLVFNFESTCETSILDNRKKQGKVLFVDVQDWKSELPLENHEKAITVDNFVRGEILQQNSFYDEQSLVKHFLIEFFEGQSIGVYCLGCVVMLY